MVEALRRLRAGAGPPSPAVRLRPEGGPFAMVLREGSWAFAGYGGECAGGDVCDWYGGELIFAVGFAAGFGERMNSVLDVNLASEAGGAKMQKSYRGAQEGSGVAGWESRRVLRMRSVVAVVVRDQGEREGAR